MSVNEIEQTAGGATFRDIEHVHCKSVEKVSMLVSMSVIKSENGGGASTNRTGGAEYVGSCFVVCQSLDLRWWVSEAVGE